MLEIVNQRLLFGGDVITGVVELRRIPGFLHPYEIQAPQTEHFEMSVGDTNPPFLMTGDFYRFTVSFTPRFANREVESVQDFIGICAPDFFFKIHLIAFADGSLDESLLTPKRLRSLVPDPSAFQFEPPTSLTRIAPPGLRRTVPAQIPIPQDYRPSPGHAALSWYGSSESEPVPKMGCHS